MKKFIYILIVLFSSTIFAQTNNSNQTAYYYYYQGQKIYLNLNTQKFYLDAKNDFNTNQLNNQGLLSFTVKNENEPVNGEIKKWAKIELESQLTETEYFQKLDDLKLASTSIDLIQPSFITMDGDEIDMSSYFYVRLNQTSDLTLLQQEANNKNVLIIEQNQFMPLWYTLRLTSQTNDNTLNVSNYFYDTGYFSDVEPDFIFDNYLECSNDTNFSDLWGLLNNNNSSVDINICDAWDLTEGNGINIAVVDTGIELTHQDLVSNIDISYDTQTNSSPSQIHEQDGKFHGTHVGGTISALKDNNLQVVGVSPQSKLMPISVLFGASQSVANLAEGINWAWQNGADIINNSWGGGTPSNLISNAISNALDNGRGGKGTIVIFATGNNYSGNVNYPANSNNDILAVGSITSTGSRSGFSNYGNELDVVAPGSGILSTLLNNQIGYLNGTSMATPHVSGVAALILSVNPDLTVQEVNDIIENSAQKVGGYNYSSNGNRPNGTWNEQMGYGLVNANQAVLLAEGTLDCESDIIILGPDELPFGQQATYTTNYAGVSNGVNWSTSAAFTIVSVNGEDEITIEATGIFDGTITATIGCMHTDKEIIIYEQQEIVPYPNSSDASFNLDFTTYPPNTVYFIYIYDQYQNEVYSGESTNLEKTISTANLPSDTYYLHVYVNGELTSKQLLVQH
jgi:subtilisin family serine protease